MLGKFVLIFTLIIQRPSATSTQCMYGTVRSSSDYFQDASVFTQCPNYIPIDIAISLPPYGSPGPGLPGPGQPAPGFIPPGLVAPGIAAPGIATPGIAAPGIAAPGLAGPGLNNPYNLPLPYGLNLIGLNGLPIGLPGIFYGNMEAPINYTPTTSGALPVNSALNVPPTGASVLSENVYGPLGVAGDGIGAINYGCGNVLNAMTAFGEYSTPANAVIPSPVPIMPNPYTTPALTFATSPYTTVTPTSTLPSLATTVATPTCSAPAPIYNPPFMTPFNDLANTVLCNIAINEIDFSPTTGGAFAVFSSSTTGPVGLTVTADIGYEGPLTVSGAMPFVGTAAVDGALPVVGVGAVNHACGSGKNAMVSQGNGSPSEPVATVSATTGPCL